MPYRASPDTQYIMNSSFELLEQTPDVALSAFFSGMNLDQYFDMYDAHYAANGACAAVRNLCTLMYDWTDKQDDHTRGVILSANVYDAGFQLRELILGATGNLVSSYLCNNGVNDDRDNLMFGLVTVDGVNDRPRVNVYSERDLLFPANIATAIIQDNRIYEYLLTLKNRLKLALEIDIPLIDLQKHHIQMANRCVKGSSFVLTDDNFVVDETVLPNYATKEKLESAKKAIKKGIKKFSNLFGKKHITSFVNGDGFTIDGAKYKWHFRQKKCVSLVTMTHSPLKGHIPYELTLLDKNDVVMADCCVFVTENTPVIDQIITIVLHIQHDEDELLAHCNLFNIREEALPDSILFNNKDRICSTSQNFEQSHYSKEFNRLVDLYKPQINDKMADIVGIEPAFFKFLTGDCTNPVINGGNSHFYLDMFPDRQRLITT